MVERAIIVVIIIMIIILIFIYAIPLFQDIWDHMTYYLHGRSMQTSKSQMGPPHIDWGYLCLLSWVLSHEIQPSKKTSAISAPIGREARNLVDNILYFVLISSAYLKHLVIFFTEELGKNTYNYKEVKTDGEVQIGPCDLSKDRRQACPSFPCIPIFLLWLLAVTYSCGSHRCGGRRGKRNLFSFCRSACSSHTALPPAGFKLPGNGGGWLQVEEIWPKNLCQDWLDTSLPIYLFP